MMLSVAKQSSAIAPLANNPASISVPVQTQQDNGFSADRISTTPSQASFPALQGAQFGMLASPGASKPVIGPVGGLDCGDTNAGKGALIGFVSGTILWGALGIPAIAIKNGHKYHHPLMGILFLAIGIPAFTIIGAIAGSFCKKNAAAAKDLGV